VTAAGALVVPMSHTSGGRRRLVGLDRSFVRVVLLDDGVEVARWWLCVRPHGELAAADALARVFLAARRRGSTIALDGIEPVLRQVLGLLGLVVAERDGRLVVEVCREAEDREECRVEEVVVSDDPIP
jgi:hypothetical protein